MTDWFRCCYRFSHWKHKIGWSDGFARTHWMSDKARAEEMVSCTIEQGGEAFIEQSPAHG